MERRVVLSAEYGGKAIYGWLMGLAVGAAYAPEDLQIVAWIGHANESVFSDRRVQKVTHLGADRFIVRLPRYEAFTQVALELIDRGVTFDQIAGNDDVLVTAIAPGKWQDSPVNAELVAALPILTEAPKTRLAIRARVAALHELVAWLRARGAQVEHIYDY